MNTLTKPDSGRLRVGLMAAALLADGGTVLRRVPRLRDVDAMLELLRALGAQHAGGDGDHHRARRRQRTDVSLRRTASRVRPPL